MRIIFDHQIFSNQRYGGISRYFIELARHMPKVGVAEINIVAPLFKNEYLGHSKGQYQTLGIKVPSIPLTGQLINHVNELLSPTVLSFLNPEIIHETYYAKTAPGSSRAKRVITIHDMIHEILPEHFSVNDRTYQLKRLAVERADHIICISENTRNDLISVLGVDRKKTSVVYHGISLVSENIKSNLNFNKPFLLYVGPRNGYKNFSNLVMAYSSIPNLTNEFNLVCFGGGDFNLDEINLFKKLKISVGNVQQVSGNDMLLAQFYLNATVFVYPSLYEGFGFPPLEAMKYGCVVACSNAGSIPEVVGDAAILFDPRSLDSIADALEKAIFDSAARENKINRSIERIKLFSWERCAQETFGIYEKLLQNRGR